MWNGVGGGTIVYAAQWQRNMPSDFRVKTLDGIADDWPLTYEELEPYYVRVERDFGDLRRRRTTPRSHPARARRCRRSRSAGPGARSPRAHNELGWHWWPAPNAIATRKYGNLNPCVQRGVCLKACQRPRQGDRRHHALAGRAARRRRAGDEGDGARDHGRAGRARDRRRSTSTTRARSTAIGASVVILAANGIGTPRLLLLSGGDRHPDGLANSSGMVGRRLMMHPFGTVVGLWEDELESWQGPWGQWLHSLEFYETDHVARVRARREVGAAADRRAALHDHVVSLGRAERDLGRGLPPRLRAPLRALRDVGDHRRGPAGGGEPRHASARGPTGTGSRARRSSTRCRRTRTT